MSPPPRLGRAASLRRLFRGDGSAPEPGAETRRSSVDGGGAGAAAAAGGAERSGDVRGSDVAEPDPDSSRIRLVPSARASAALG